MTHVNRLFVGLALLAAVCSNTLAAKKESEPVLLTPAGEKLLARYTEMLEGLKKEIIEALPVIDETRKAAFLKAYKEEALATAAELKAMRAQDRKSATDPAKKAYEAAKEARVLATEKAQPLAEAMLADLKDFLKGDKLDAQLVKCVILTEATPRGLTEFAQQGREHEQLIETLLADVDLMKQMLIADGARNGKYGRAMKIYTSIQKISPLAKYGPLQRLALAISLEHAVPVKQTNPKDRPDAPATIDPVKRYLHYEKAFLAGELDPAFKDLTVWEYRNVVNGDETDEVLAWGRKMLRNYRPDLIYTSDYRWRYVNIVRTDVKYGSEGVKNDLPSLHKYQNILMNGGVCGRRAFFGRFILRAFGIPTTARPQRGHASLTHWTPDGWVICLGATWGWGWTRYGQDLDFLAYTQARKNKQAFLEALRARWVGTILGEKKVLGFHDPPSGFWNAVSLYRQRAIIEETKTAVGKNIGEAKKSKETVTEANKRIIISKDGVIIIPAAACTRPTHSTKKIIFMRNFDGGTQLHYSRLGKPEAFEYKIEVPKTGKYALIARVVTVNRGVRLLLKLNGADTPIDIPIPYTMGMWGWSQPVELSLVEGKNALSFTMKSPNHGLSIKYFRLTPVD